MRRKHETTSLPGGRGARTAVVSRTCASCRVLLGRWLGAGSQREVWRLKGPLATSLDVNPPPCSPDNSYTPTTSVRCLQLTRRLLCRSCCRGRDRASSQSGRRRHRHRHLPGRRDGPPVVNLVVNLGVNLVVNLVGRNHYVMWGASVSVGFRASASGLFGQGQQSLSHVGEDCVTSEVIDQPHVRTVGPEVLRARGIVRVGIVEVEVW